MKNFLKNWGLLLFAGFSVWGSFFIPHMTVIPDDIGIFMRISGVCAGITMILGSFYLLVRAFCNIQEQGEIWEKRKNFNSVFSFNPPESEKERTFLQQYVDSTLSQRAIVYIAACDAESELLSRRANQEDGSDLSREDVALYQARLRTLQETIPKIKQAFWFAHGAAKVYDFEVKETAREHIVA